MFGFGSVMDGLFLNSPILQCTWKNFSCFLTYESFPCPCHEDIQGEQSYRWHSFLNSPLDGSEWPTLRPGRLTTGQSPLYSLNVRLGGTQSLSWRREKSLAHTWIRTPCSSSPWHGHYTDYSTQFSCTLTYSFYIIIIFINCNWVITQWQW
jgi:hypothetical protein